MPIDDRTANRNYKLPNAGNFLADDVARLRDALNSIDADVFARYTKTEVDQLIANLINGAPGALDTLNELAAAMGNDPNFAATVTNSIAAINTALGNRYTKAESDARYVQGSVQTEMIFTAGINQTAYTLTTGIINKASALVTVDGVVQPTSEYSLSMDGLTLTLSEAPAQSAKVRVLALGVASPGAPADDTVTTAKLRDGAVTNAKVASNAAIAATKLSFTQAGTGAVARTIDSRLKDFVSTADFGTVADGVADDTAALKAAFDYAIPLGLPVRLKGTYLITGPIQPYATRASGELHIVCDGDVAINVSASAAGFHSVLYFHTTAQNRASIVGGDLSINGSNKAGRGIAIRHEGATGGEVTISSRLRLLNFLETSATEVNSNHALAVTGDYSRVVIEQPFISGVARTNTSAGACQGIAVSGFTGEVTINQPYIQNVLVPSLSSSDADGISAFGKAVGTTYNSRPGKVTINQPTFVDCQGRSFKSQCSDSTVIRPEVRRKNYVSIVNSVEFDFQFGNGLVIEPEYEYRLNGATSPLGSSHSCVAFQQLLDDAVMCGKSIGGVLRTEVLVLRYAAVIHQSGSLFSHTEVSGLRVIPIGSLTTKAINRAIIETDMSTVVAKTEKTRLVVDNVSGPTQCLGIGYTGYTSGSLASKLSWSVQNCTNTLAVTSSSRPFHSLSGSTVTEVESFVMRNNQGFRNLFSNGWTFTFDKLQPGCQFTADIANVVATGAPGWGASGYALVEVLDCWFSDTDKMIRVTKDNATVANTVFYTQNGGTTWGTIK